MLPEIDQQLNKDIRKIQEKGLKDLLSYLNLHSPYYNDFFHSNGLDTNSIQSLFDLEKIPPTTIDALQLRHWDSLGGKKNQIEEYCITSDSLGNH